MRGVRMFRVVGLVLAGLCLISSSRGFADQEGQ